MTGDVFGDAVDDVGLLRANLLAAIRDYFREQQVIETVTPVMGRHGVSDPHLQNLQVHDAAASYYLQTSPEYAMKKILARDKRSIYQICPAFRGGESGRRHLTEFQMLEWYRCGFDLTMMMDDVESLFSTVGRKLGLPANHAFANCELRRLEYGALFSAAFGVNPHDVQIEGLQSLADAAGLAHLDAGSSSRADYLDGLFATQIEPELVDPCIVFDFPACQSALARLKRNSNNDLVSERFEVFARGLELANAYYELNDVAELRARFASNVSERASRGIAAVDIDEELLANTNDLPVCSGIALGIDRLLMVMADIDDINTLLD